MDPITIIVTAIVLGAAAGLKAAATQVVQDAYAGLKALIKRKYAQVNIGLLEQDPTSSLRQGVVKEDLGKTDAAQDRELLQQAQVVLSAIEDHAPETTQAVGVSLEDIKGASLRIEDIIASGAGVIVSDAEVTGDIEIKSVRAGGGGQGRPKAPRR